MAKKKPHLPPQKIGHQLPAATANTSKVPSLMAAIFNGSKVLEKPTPKELSTVDALFLDELSATLPPDKAGKFLPWLECFSAFCRELEKKNEALSQERVSLFAQLEGDKEVLNQQRSEQAKQHAEEAMALDQERSGLQRQREQLEAEQQRFRTLEDSLGPRLEEVARKHSTLQEQELALEARELDARNGFSTTRQLLLEALKLEIRSLEAERDGLMVNVEHLKDSFTREQHARDAELSQRAHALETETNKLDRARQRLQRDRIGLEEERQQLEEEGQSALEQEREQHRRELERRDAKLTRMGQVLDDERRQSDGLIALREAFGERDPHEVLDEARELQRENGILRKNGGAVEAERLEQENQGLRERLAILQTSLRELSSEHEQAKAELSRKRMGALDLESLSMEKRGLEKHKQLLGAALIDLETRIDSLTATNKTQSAFPQLTAMDEQQEFRTSAILEPVPEDLRAFANELQQRIAMAEPGTRLFYGIDDIRTLLGGLAMSQLHVFQGISGTGKTSLAKAFAKAIGGFCTDIAVQAGWRDRDDLLGHYNAFEKRFYEKDCLQGLYKAQTEAWHDCCNVILLDEMNLSRPEQYFAEFLSALEKNNPSERLITLSEHVVAQAPSLLKEHRKILVPKNVWFIGTANHDETTSELADKTYDRAHVMTLPRHEDTFVLQPVVPVRYSYTSLQKRFDAAIAHHANEVTELLAELQSGALTEALGEQFGLGWGNRFERQAKRFIPVMMACGASKQDALDHLLATRVMRSGKVTGRYDITLDTLNGLETVFDQFWNGIGGDAPKSRKLIDDDRRRKERTT